MMVNFPGTIITNCHRAYGLNEVNFNFCMHTQLFIFFIFLCFSLRAQYYPADGIYPDVVFNEKIKTARVFKADWETSYPISHMDDENALTITFDELSETAKNYSYIIVHCDADWRQSRLNTTEYMDGFAMNYIRDYEFSFNTLIPYVHYRLSVPNEDVRLKVSGNFAVVVFEDGREDRPVLCKRFSIAESLAVISASAGQARQTAFRNEWQQVDFVVRTVNYPIENAHQDIKIVILKNGRWHTALTGLKPLFIRPNELDYRHETGTLFPAGNEFRPLDIKSTQFSSTPMRTINFQRPTYQFFPHTDESRSTSRYVYYEDFNGKYAILSDKARNPDVETDYVYVHFSLQMPFPFDDGQVYVLGDFCNYACTPENLMIYNSGKQQYEVSILLKQGYYNYEYAFLPFKKAVINDTMLEGNFSDTENDYTIYVYHRGRSSRYDRLIGVSTVNTLKR